MVNHMVLLKIREGIAPKVINGLFLELDALREKIQGIESFSWGPYSSREGLNRGFTHGFLTTFRDAASRDIYLDHPAHEAVKVKLLEVLDGGVDGVVAFDYET